MPRPTLLGLLRAAAVVVAALTVSTVLPRLGLPARLVPDLVVILVAASAVLRGRVHGAFVGLAAGWVVDLLPPGGSPLGATALLYAAAGAVAGTFHHPGNRGVLAPLGSVAAASVVVQVGRLAFVVLSDGGGGVGVGVQALSGLDLDGAASQVAATVVASLLLMPIGITVDRALVRRRLA
ncbi:MAG: rod shape-determining protein MreD [Lapillicoccus sp.]